MRGIAVVACCALLLTGCARNTEPTAETDQPSPTITPTPEPTPCALEGASTETKKTDTEPPISPVKEVRFNADSCPRIVFDFEGQVAQYEVKYVEPPITDCGEGSEISTDGWGADAFLDVRLFPSGGPDEDGEPTYKGKRDIAVNDDVLKHLKVTCDFEAVFQWVIGVDKKRGFTVTTFDDPPRLVIDITEASDV